jgi:predicted ribosomally synthesized peptide with nif11-like leader
MSIKSAEAYIARVKTDQRFAARVTECQDFASLQSLLASEGFSFTPRELASLADGLTNAHLDKVAGGLLTNPQIIDAITQSNVKVVGEGPAEAMALSAQALAHAMGLAMENAAQTQGGMQQVNNAARAPKGWPR